MCRLNKVNTAMKIVVVSTCNLLLLMECYAITLQTLNVIEISPRIALQSISALRWLRGQLKDEKI